MRSRKKRRCGRCKGTGFVVEEDEWRKCRCQILKDLRRQMIDAGVEDPLWVGKGWSKLNLDTREFDYLANYASGIMLLHGDRRERRWCVAALLLRDCALAGGTVLALRLNNLVASLFKKDSPERSLAMQCDLLWLRCDFLSKHSWNRPVAHGLFIDRGSKRTIVTADSSDGVEIPHMELEL